MSNYIPVELQRQVRRFGNCCAYCRAVEALTVTQFEIEHIVPRSVGGATEFANTCLACPSCNRFKADRTLVRDPDTLHVVPLFHPQQDGWNDHFEWSEEATQIVGLTAIGRATIVALKMNRPQLIRVRRMWITLGQHPPELE